MMSGEADCPASGGSSYILEPPLSNLINSKSNKVNINNNENTDCDLEKAVCASTNIINNHNNNSNSNSSSCNNNSNNNNNNNNNNSNSVSNNNNNNNSITKNNNNSNLANSIHAAVASTAAKFLNDAANLDGKLLLKCDRCDNFETILPAMLAVHTAQCRGDIDGTALNFVQRLSGTETDTVAAASSSSSSSIANHLTNESGNTSGSSKNAATSSSLGNSSGQQQQHQRKLFECDVCNMKFSNGANMRRHKMRHTGVKPYECRVCQKRFFRKDHLAEHFTTHTKTLPYHCPICNRGFQRQIAMRAHFQNEHVGQHDLVKTCPLCSYRAGTMKSLRIHFFNRHGIDLDNPGPNAPSSLLLALDPTNSANYLPSIALAAAAAAANAANSTSLGISGNSNGGPTYSDSGDSLRSADNGTPPMHFLTPHVEISMADNDSFKSEPMSANVGTGLEIQPCSLTTNSGHPLNGGDSPSPHSADSNSNVPSSSQSLIGSVLQSARHHLMLEAQITPSISLIPIKQEPLSEEYDSSVSKSMRQQNVDQQSGSWQSSNTVTSNAAESTASSSTNLTSLIKVSPLKSLLREDLKRRISARATNRATRNNGGNHTIPSSSPSTSMTNINSSSSNSNNATSIQATTNESTTISVSSANSTLAAVATTSNGVITSTGPETELHQRGGIISDNERGKRMLQCLFCGIEFPDQTLYFLHKGCHSESNPWKCNICGEQCNNVYEFNSHLLSKSHQ